MDYNTLILIAGAILSLLFSYIPGLNIWYAALQADTKRLIMAGVLLVTSAAIFGLVCAGLAGDFGLTLTCDKQTIIGLIKTFVLALIANQTTYAITPQTTAVKKLKASTALDEHDIQSYG